MSLKLRKLISSEIVKILRENTSLTNSLSVNVIEDRLIIKSSTNPESNNIIEIPLSKVPELLDYIFNSIQVDSIPTNYRKSFITKLIGKRQYEPSAEDAGGEGGDDEPKLEK